MAPMCIPPQVASWLVQPFLQCLLVCPPHSGAMLVAVSCICVMRPEKLLGSCCMDVTELNKELKNRNLLPLLWSPASHLFKIEMYFTLHVLLLYMPSVLLPSVLWHCWLGGRKGIRPVVGVGVWLSVWSKVQTCIWPSWCHCHSLSLASLKSRLVLPFWYRLTWVVSDKGPLNGCVWVCVSTCIRHPYWGWPCWNFITDFTFIQKTPVRGLSCSIVCTMMACGRRMDRWTQIPCQHSFTLYKWKIARFDCDDYSLVVVWIMEGVCKSQNVPYLLYTDGACFIRKYGSPVECLDLHYVFMH